MSKVLITALSVFSIILFLTACGITDVEPDRRSESTGEITFTVNGEPVVYNPSSASFGNSTSFSSERLSIDGLNGIGSGIIGTGTVDLTLTAGSNGESLVDFPDISYANCDTAIAVNTVDRGCVEFRFIFQTDDISIAGSTSPGDTFVVSIEEGDWSQFGYVKGTFRGNISGSSFGNPIQISIENGSFFLAIS